MDNQHADFKSEFPAHSPSFSSARLPSNIVNALTAATGQALPNPYVARPLHINGPRYRTPFATMVLHCTDGSTSELQLAGGTHALRCLGPYVPPLLGLIQPPQTELAWLGTNPFLMQNAPNQGLHLFRSTLNNPKPGLKVTSIDYMSAMGDGAPLLAGLTIE